MELSIVGVGVVEIVEEIDEYDAFVVVTEKGELVVISREVIDVSGG